MVTAFIFWSAIYAVIKWSRGCTIKEAVFAFIKGNYHLWFLFMIVGLYIIVPIMRHVVHDRETARYFIILAIVFGFVIPRGFQLFEILELPYFSDLVTTMQTAYSQMYFHLTLGYVAYFVLGYYLHQYKVSKATECIIYIFGICGACAIYGLTEIYSIHEGIPKEHFYEYLNIFVLMESIAVFVLAKYSLSKIRISSKAQNVVAHLAKYGFGIYLVHVMLVDIMNTDLNIHVLMYNPAYMVPILATGVWGVSLVISIILNNIPFLRKYIV